MHIARAQLYTLKLTYMYTHIECNTFGNIVRNHNFSENAKPSRYKTEKNENCDDSKSLQRQYIQTYVKFKAFSVSVSHLEQELVPLGWVRCIHSCGRCEKFGKAHSQRRDEHSLTLSCSHERVIFFFKAENIATEESKRNFEYTLRS